MRLNPHHIYRELNNKVTKKPVILLSGEITTGPGLQAPGHCIFLLHEGSRHQIPGFPAPALREDVLCLTLTKKLDRIIDQKIQKRPIFGHKIQ